MFKRISCMILAVVMLASLCVCGVSASETDTITDTGSKKSGSCGANLTWRLESDGVLHITGSGAMYDFNYNFDTAETDIPWYQYTDQILHIDIASTVTSIGRFAFRGLKNVCSVNIPYGVKSIGNNAFWTCSNLESVEIPSSVTSIGSNAFYKTGLTSVTIPEGVTTLNSGTFYQCTKLTIVNLPKSLTTINDEAFRGCAALTDVYYSGSQSQWNAITIGTYNTPLTNAILHTSVEAHTHSYTVNKVEPTCTVEGYTKYDCACGYSYTGDIVAALGHSFTNYVSNNDATTTADGTKTAKCDCCTTTDTIVDEGSKLPAGKNGWVQEGGKWYYYENNVKVTNDWRADSAGKCYLSADGTVLKNGWAKENGQWRYLNQQGYITLNNWAKDSYGWCFLDENGYMVYNTWKKDSKGWCYIGAYGYLITNNWAKDSVGWCFLDQNGYMVYNTWKADTKGWCYVGARGYMVTNGWAKDSVGWCWMGSEGYMVKDRWVKDAGKWYYINSSGYMVSKQWIKDSKGWCYLNASGYMVYSQWVQDSKGWYYVNSSGYKVISNWVKDGSYWYYMGSNGVMLANTKITVSGNIYYLDANGRMLTSCEKNGGCIGADGVWKSGHSWNAATCSKPKYCSGCGKTEGSTASHSWKNATCTSAKTCTVCGITSGSALGHQYSGGMCTRCGVYSKTYSAGEKWIVSGEWEFTINSVKLHYLCNNYANSQEGYTNEPVVLISYTYKNIGYQNSNMDLYFSSMDMDVYDGSGYSAELYACTHEDYSDECVYGTSCTASCAYILEHSSSSIKIVVEKYGSHKVEGRSPEYSAVFQIPITDDGSGGITSSWTSSDINTVMSELVTAITYADTAKFCANNGQTSAAKSYAKQARSEVTTAAILAMNESDLLLSNTQYTTVQDALQAAHDLLDNAYYASSASTISLYASQAYDILYAILDQYYWK